MLANLMAYVNHTEGRHRELYLKRLDTFAEKHADSYYGKEARRLHQSLAR